MRPVHEIHERVIGEVSQEQELHHPQMLDALPVAIYTPDIAGWITYSDETIAALIGADLHSDQRWVTRPQFRPDGPRCRTLSAGSDLGGLVRGTGSLLNVRAGLALSCWSIPHCFSTASADADRRWGGVNGFN